MTIIVLDICYNFFALFTRYTQRLLSYLNLLWQFLFCKIFKELRIFSFLNYYTKLANIFKLSHYKYSIYQRDVCTVSLIVCISRFIMFLYRLAHVWQMYNYYVSFVSKPVHMSETFYFFIGKNGSETFGTFTYFKKTFELWA